MPRCRPLCRSRGLRTRPPVTENPGFAGYATAIGLGEAVNEWVRTHNYALSVIVHTYCRSTGGAKLNARLGRVVIFNVLSQPNSDPAHNDPARSFMIRTARLSPSFFAPTLGDPEDRSRLNPRPGDSCMEAGFRGDPASGNMTPAGFMPISLSIEGTTVMLATYCAVYRASHHPDDAPLDEETEATFDDLRNVFVNFINNGIVLRAPADGRGVDPDAGKTSVKCSTASSYE